MIPAAPVEAGAQSVVGWKPAASEPIDDHLPDAVLNAPKNILNLADSFRRIQE